MKRKWGMALIGLAVASAAFARGIVDPTRPPWMGVPAGSMAPKRQGLRAILLDGPRRLALINGQLLGVGSRVGQSRIVAIHHYAVVLAGRMGRQQLQLDTRSPQIQKAAVLKEGTQ
ncbi:MAG: hypothetical protein ACYDEV_08385 [Acidiferrobacter sp.]